jgi:hypothetical protein
MGFFAEAGPLTVFVSNHLIAEEFEFETTQEPCYVTPDGDQKLVAGCEVRLRVVGTRVDASEIVSARWRRRRGAARPRTDRAPPAAACLPCASASPYAARASIECSVAWPTQFAVGSIKEDFCGVIGGPA